MRNLFSPVLPPAPEVADTNEAQKRQYGQARFTACRQLASGADTVDTDFAPLLKSSSANSLKVFANNANGTPAITAAQQPRPMRIEAPSYNPPSSISANRHASSFHRQDGNLLTETPLSTSSDSNTAHSSGSVSAVRESPMASYPRSHSNSALSQLSLGSQSGSQSGVDETGRSDSDVYQPYVDSHTHYEAVRAFSNDIQAEQPVRLTSNQFLRHGVKHLDHQTAANAIFRDSQLPPPSLREFGKVPTSNYISELRRPYSSSMYMSAAMYKPQTITQNEY